MHSANKSTQNLLISNKFWVHTVPLFCFPCQTLLHTPKI